MSAFRSLLASFRAEFLKIVTLKMWWVLLLVLSGYVGFTAGLLAAVFGGLGDQLGQAGNAPAIPEALLPPVIFSVASSVGYVFPLLFGTLSTTGEFRHQTLTPTFLATPHRGVVLLAKLKVSALFGALYGVVGLLTTVGIGTSILAATGHATGLAESDTWALFARTVLAMALWAIIGVGVGAMIPNQVAAIVVVLAFTQFVEPILRAVSAFADWAAQIGRFLPGAASDALVGSSVFTAMGGATGATLTLEWWQGGLVLLALAVATTGIGFYGSWRRDVT